MERKKWEDTVEEVEAEEVEVEAAVVEEEVEVAVEVVVLVWKHPQSLSMDATIVHITIEKVECTKFIQIVQAMERKKGMILE